MANKIKWGEVALLALGSVAVAGSAFAINGLTLSKTMSGLIKLGVGGGVGLGVSMVSKPIGAGIAGGGIALGTVDLASQALGGLATAAAANGTANGDAASTSSIRANLSAVASRVQLPQTQRRGNVHVSQAANDLRAIVTRLPGR